MGGVFSQDPSWLDPKKVSGEYTLATWFESLGENKKVIKADSEALRDIEFTYKPKKKLNFQ